MVAVAVGWVGIHKPQTNFFLNFNVLLLLLLLSLLLLLFLLLLFVIIVIIFIK